MLLIAEVMSEFESIRDEYTKILYLYDSVKKGDSSKVKKLLEEIDKLEYKMDSFLEYVDPTSDETFDSILSEIEMIRAKIRSIKNEVAPDEITNELFENQEDSTKEFENTVESPEVSEDETEDYDESQEETIETNKVNEELSTIDVSSIDETIENNKEDSEANSSSEDYILDDTNIDNYTEKEKFEESSETFTPVNLDIYTVDNAMVLFANIESSDEPTNVKIAKLYNLLSEIYNRKLYTYREARLLETKIINTILKLKLELFSF